LPIRAHQHCPISSFLTIGVASAFECIIHMWSTFDGVFYFIFPCMLAERTNLLPA